MKPKLLVGSSRENSRLAGGIQANLTEVDVRRWDYGVFSPGDVTLDALIKGTMEFDFAVFVFVPDDVVKIRDQESATVRDNVLFEFGLFMGKLGRQRVFMLLPQNLSASFRLPTDLLGLTTLTYDAEQLDRESNAQVVLGRACSVIQSRIEAIEREWAKSVSLTGDLVLLLRYLQRDEKATLRDQYVKSIASFYGSPEEVDQQTGRAWRTAVRYLLL
jgi:predicted nucleotide-binding protein